MSIEKNNLHLPKINNFNTPTTPPAPKAADGLIRKIGSFIRAFFAKIIMIPVIINKAWIQKFGKTSTFTFDNKLVDLARKNEIVSGPIPIFGIADDAISSEDQLIFKDVDSSEVINLQDQIQEGNYQKVNLNKLNNSILPKHQMKMGEVTYYCSDLIRVSPGNVGVFALVKIKDKVYTRIFYRSNSQ
ncbi:MAG: hypothetical protein H0W88_08090 [Parachlamydiaceae bacterium]|nr:hypothetical protein [Parachlamydiaceae bacterium]